MRYFSFISLIFAIGFNTNLLAQEIERTNITEPVSPYLSTIDDLAIVFSNVSIISLENNQVYPGMVVLIKGDRIQKIESSEYLEVPHGSRVIPSDGKYLIAGMIPADLLSSENLQLSIDNISRHFGRYQSVSEGNLANLILLSSNPLEREKTIEKFDGIMIRGLWYDRESVLKKLDDVKKLYP